MLTWLDDHSRYALHGSAHPRITGWIVVETFTETAARHGYPASVLTGWRELRLIAGGKIIRGEFRRARGTVVGKEPTACLASTTSPKTAGQVTSSGSDVPSPASVGHTHNSPDLQTRRHHAGLIPYEVRENPVA